MSARLLAPATVLASLVTALLVAPAASAAASSSAAATSGWPVHGQAAYRLGTDRLHASRGQHAAPIASVAKVMTAYRVLRAYPVTPGHHGFTMVVRRRDVADTEMRRNRGDSYVPVRAGERLTEAQALAALLLPSANNIAIMLARKVSGTVPRFVRLMNATARRLGMRHTHYTDPSGSASDTVATAVDQMRLAPRALAQPMFRYLVRQRSYRIPVAGRVENTDALLGSDGFAGVKTGMTSWAGGCFLFLSHRLVHGRRVDIVGVVLGQRGSDLHEAAFRAARRLVDAVAPRAA